MKKRKNHSPEFKAKVALEAIREEMILAVAGTHLVIFLQSNVSVVI